MNTTTAIALTAGTIGVAIPCLVLAGNSSAIIQIGVMISGALIFGSGVIASAISANKSEKS